VLCAKFDVAFDGNGVTFRPIDSVSVVSIEAVPSPFHFGNAFEVWLRAVEVVS